MTSTPSRKKEGKHSPSEEKTFPATVSVVNNPCRLVINRGSRHDVKEGQEFLIYSMSDEEITDPVTGKSLGFLETVKGRGVVSHVQELMSTIESKTREPGQRRIIRRKPSASIFGILAGMSEEEIITPSANLIPFDHAEVGDKARPI